MQKTSLLLVFLLLSSPLFSQAKMEKIAGLDKDLKETSGLVYYQNKYLISHNDGGNKSEIFVMNLAGNLLRKIEIDGADNDDWEDLTTDNKGNLYIGDFGNNENKRKKCQIYIVKKGFIDKDKVEAEKISFTYEDQDDYPPKKKHRDFDCEAFFWKDGQLILFTKSRAKPFKGLTKIYTLPDKKGKYEAELIGSINLCKIGWRFCSVTSADYDKKTNQLVLLSYSKVYLFSDFDENEFWNGNIRSFTLETPRQREAICFIDRNSFYITDEKKKGFSGGNLHKLRLE
jgi:hypothetical protein